MSDDSKAPGIETARPPPNLDDDPDDLYSASTVVGEASPELLAIVRDAEESRAAKTAASVKPGDTPTKPPPPPSADEAKLAAMMEAASRAAKQAAANEIARDEARAASGAPPARPSSRPTPHAPAFISRAQARPARAAVSAAAAEPDEAPPSRAVEPESATGGSLPPLVGIVLLFAAASIVLALIVR